MRTTFVLVHGAWIGGWIWKKLAPLLRAAGHEVFTPTLTGLGERRHLLGPDVGLDTHVEDVVAVLENEDLNDVVLVGHSYAGLVVSGVAQRAAERLAEIVYLDSCLPEDGKAAYDYVAPLPTREDGWRVPPIGPPEVFGVPDEPDAAWLTSRLGDHPVKAFTQPLKVSAARTRGIPQTYILCSQFPPSVEAAGRARRENLRVVDLTLAGHCPMVTRPDELASLLLDPRGSARQPVRDRTGSRETAGKAR